MRGSLAAASMERCLQKNLEFFGAPDFDAADEEFARKIFETTPEPGRFEDLEKRVRGAGKAGREALAEAKKDPLPRRILPYVPSGVPMGGSTDVGDVSWQTPTAQIYMGTWANSTPGHSWQVVTVGKSPLAHKGMLQAGKVMAAAGYDLMTDPELLKKAQEELKERLRGETYVPIPKGVAPRGLSGAKS